MAKSELKKKPSVAKVSSPKKNSKDNKRIEIRNAENGWIVTVTIESNDNWTSTTYIAATEKELASILASVR